MENNLFVYTVYIWNSSADMLCYYFFPYMQKCSNYPYNSQYFVRVAFKYAIFEAVC